MPYKIKGQCVYKKDTGAKVGCTKGDVNKYMAALHTNVDEGIIDLEKTDMTTAICNGFNYSILGKPAVSENKIKGGKADKLSLKDISDKFNVPLSSLQKQLEIGKKVEHEHTGDTTLAAEIALDHLSEIPDYYTRLKKMEKLALNKWDSKQSIKENIKSILYGYLKR